VSVALAGLLLALVMLGLACLIGAVVYRVAQ
jgi:hypothetical protein